MKKKLINYRGIKKILLLFLLIEIVSLPLQANPGDTTWVTVFNLKKLTYPGSYDTVSVFPTNKRYRKIRMHYILGRYACVNPPNGYCGSWDYTTQLISRPAGKDSVELARIITPYATDWLSKNKKHDYVVDITDYASALDGTTSMRFNYFGYSYGFTITIKIEFIEGVPPMDALSVKNVYDGSFPYGNATNSIENYLTAKTLTYTSPTSKVFLKNTVTGHGSDAQGCGEFCSKYYQLKINNSMVSQKQLWRSDCGLNQEYPQTGTWIYERANWCPGAIVWPIYHDLTSITSANTTFTTDVDMQPYTVSNPSASFHWVSQFIQYSAPNHTTDVAIEEIIAPTTNENFFRNNPSCQNPVIRIRNTGTDSLTSVAFNYGLKNGTVLTHTWTGSLGFLDQTDVVFPPSASILSGSVNATFQVSVTAVNGSAGDQNLFNNIYQSATKPVAKCPKDMIIKILTNNAASENTWTLYDEYDNVIATRNNMASASTYADTIKDLYPGCYRFSLDDTGCDGLYFWNNASAGNGSLYFLNITGSSVVYSFPKDVGCNYTYYFVVAPPPPPPVDTTAVAENFVDWSTIEVYPNPAQNMAYVKLDLSRSQSIAYELTDINGRAIKKVSAHRVSSTYETIDLSALSNGVYFVRFEMEDRSIVNKKLVIQK